MEAASLVPALLGVSTIPDLPDYLSNYRQFMLDEVFRNVASRKTASIDKLIESAIGASIGMIIRYSQEVAEPGTSAKNARILQFEVALDLMDACGLLLLFSDLHARDYFGPVKETFDRLIKPDKKTKGLMTLFSVVLDAKVRLPILSPGAMRRQAWQRAFVDDGADIGLWDLDHYASDSPPRMKPISPLLEALNVHLGNMFDDPSVVFAARFLAIHPSLADIKWSQAVIDFSEKFARVEKFREAERENYFSKPISTTDSSHFDERDENGVPCDSEGDVE